ncbi:MAG: zinc finger Ran-binding domain-containing protein [Actinomycetota bacterium]
MPEIDADLFQIIVMGLLVVLLIALLLVLNNLTKLGKSIDEAMSGSGAARGGEARTRQDTPAGGGSGYTDVPQQQSYTPPAQSAYEPPVKQTQQPEPQTHQPQTASQPAAAQQQSQEEPMPEEQPFERQGRWWFKRGDELLVYDEQQGQWQPAPAGSLGHGGPESIATEFQSLSDSAPAAASSPEAGWKCSSCGAVNGATATTCRMCFASRP